MEFGRIVMTVVLGIALTPLSAPAQAAGAKTATPKQVRTGKAPTHVEVYGKKVEVAPPGTMTHLSKRPDVKKDLSVVGLRAPDAIRLNEPFQVSFYIRNLGAATVAQVSYKVALVPVAPPLAWPAESLATGVVHDVRAGRDVRIERRVAIKGSVPYIEAGAWPILAAVVDPDEVVAEDDEENNLMAIIVYPEN